MIGTSHISPTLLLLNWLLAEQIFEFKNLSLLYKDIQVPHPHQDSAMPAGELLKIGYTKQTIYSHQKKNKHLGIELHVLKVLFHRALFFTFHVIVKPFFMWGLF